MGPEVGISLKFCFAIRSIQEINSLTVEAEDVKTQRRPYLGFAGT